MIISKLILAQYSLTSYLSFDRQNFGILLNNCSCTMVSIPPCSQCHVRVRAFVCVCVWGGRVGGGGVGVGVGVVGEHVCVCSVCLSALC